MNNIEVYRNEQFGEIRGAQINGSGWLVGKDVAAILGYVNPSKAILMHVD